MIDFYTSANDAKIEIKKRQQDEKLKKKVGEFLNGDIPVQFEREPRAVMFRQICIPDSETARFIKHAHFLELKPFVFEYYDDKFTTVNPDKLRWGRIDVFEKMNKNNEPIIKATHIMDYHKNDGKKIKELYTIWGQNVIDFFHESFSYLQVDKPEMQDMSIWLKNNGSKSDKYYKNFFSLFVTHGVYLENFVLDGGDVEPFFQEIAYPAFSFVQEKFGIKPLIVQVFSQEEIERCDQWYFEKKMQKILNKKLV